MKNDVFVRLLTCLILVTFWSCSSESVQPKDDRSNQPTLAADLAHPEIYPICSDQKVYGLIDEGGNTTIQYCGFLPCAGPQPEWGTVTMFNDTASLYLNIQLAFGWQIKLSESFVGLESDIAIVNGIPEPESNWLSYGVHPVVGSYQIKIPLDGLTSNCFSIAGRIVVVKLDFFSGEDVNSITNLWIRNDNWNDSSFPEDNTNSIFVNNWCFQSCGPEITEVTGGSCSGCNSENTVTFYDCDSVDVWSCKDLSNVVLVYTDGSFEKYDNLSGHNGFYDGTGSNADKEISHIYVKSGCFKSGEGPGFGRRYEGPCFDASLVNAGGGNGGGGNGNGGGKGKNK